nr:ParA family protein [Desulfovibrio aminophilus]
MGARILAVANQKGGVGKTTTALTLGAALARQGGKVLVMDLDPHGNASVHLTFYPENLDYTAYDLFHAEEGDANVWDRIIKRREGLVFDFVPGHIRLSELEVDLKDRKNKGLILSQALARVRDRYDFVLLDCPPHVGVLLVNALVASDLVIIPIQTDFLALYGIRLLFDTIRLLNKVLPRPVRFMALATMHDRRASACRKILRLMRDKLGERVFETVINLDTRFRDACAQGRVIFELDPDTRGALEYSQLAKEIVSHENT